MRSGAGSRRAWSLAGGLLALGAVFPAGAAARTSCSYSGAPANVLTVRVTDESIGEIQRRGLDIAVRRRGGRFAACAGGAPTVLNTDTIRVVLVELSFVDIDLGGGPFAPGATAEPEGASEIEIEVRPGLGAADIVGTSAADEWHWGPAGANPGLNLNPRDAGDQDVDVTISANEDTAGSLVALGGRGNDAIVGAPGATVRGVVVAEGGDGDDALGAPGFAGRGAGLGYAQLDGGDDDDAILGGRAGDELEGGTGADVVDGGGGADKITGGRGRDRLFGRAGRDVIDSRDASTDTVSCGSGRDRVHRDRRDRVTGCERSGRR